MEEEFKKEIKFSLLKKLTGTRNPKIKRIISSIIALIIVFLVGGYAGYQYNNFLTPTTANANFGSYVEEDYIPIEITNGAKLLDSGELNVKTCFMKDYQNYSVPNLVPTQSHSIHFKDNETLLALGPDYNSQTKCNPRDIPTTAQCWINIYLVDDKLYAPPQECNVKRCDYCSYYIIYKVKGENIINDTKKFSATEIQKYTLNVSSSVEIPNFENKNKTYFDKIGISFYTEYESCKLSNKTNCDNFSKDFKGNRTMIVEYPDKIPIPLNLKITYTSDGY